MQILEGLVGVHLARDGSHSPASHLGVGLTHASPRPTKGMGSQAAQVPRTMRRSHVADAAAAMHLLLLCSTACAKTVTIRNDVPRVDVAGAVMDSHSQSLLEHDGTFFLYGEMYANTTGMDWSWKTHPRLGVYTSTDMMTWQFRGMLFNDSVVGTEWVPSVIYDETRQRFVAWFGAGGWSVGVSNDGIHFDLLHRSTPSRFPLGTQLDGNDLFVDDDGSAYVIFSLTKGLNSSSWSQSHTVSIERLAPDLTESSRVNVTGMFPDAFVEGATLFKRGDTYYATYGQCCCACRAGSGFVVLTAPSVAGPWMRQTGRGGQSDVNCAAAAADPMCKANFTIPFQIYSVNRVSTAPAAGSGGSAYIVMGNRWLQGPHNPAGCGNMCAKPEPAACAAQPSYRVAKDPTYWGLLQFDANGAILPFTWTDSFQLDLPGV